jgi:hypothetical protein
MKSKSAAFGAFPSTMLRVVSLSICDGEER